MQHARQCRDLVAHLGRQLKLQPVRMGEHALFQHLHQFLGFTTQQGFSAMYIIGIRRSGDEAYARGRATLNLIQQTGRTVGKYRVFAGA